MNDATKILVIIPARKGSKRLPGKNLLLFQGKPLLVHSIEYAAELGLEHCYVSTDGTEIKTQALYSGAQIIDRPANLATDTTSTIAVLQHAIKTLNFNDGWVVLLQPTNPLRPTGLFKDAFKLLQTTGADSLFTISPSNLKLGTLKEGRFIPANYKFGQRSQELQKLFFENGLLYITSPKLIEQGFIIGSNHTSLVVDHPYAQVDIDTEADFKFAEFIAKSY